MNFETAVSFRLRRSYKRAILMMKRTMRDIQRIQLETLIDIRNVCEKHDLTYAHYCGTLLGCIRHGGFIPWDDDIDIVMPLRDFRRFRKIFPCEPGMAEKYVLDCLDTDLYASNTWIKINRRGTFYAEKSLEGVRYDLGISVDIYPLIGAPESTRLKAAQSLLLKAAAVFCDSEYRRGVGFVPADDKQRRIGEKVDRLPRGVRTVLAKVIRAVCFADPDRYRHCGTVDGAPFAGKYLRADWNSFTERDFEGEVFAIPAAYDRFLTTMYGDYMTLPPEWARRPHHRGEVAVRIPQELLDRAPKLASAGCTGSPETEAGV